ncbi:ribonuclease BN, putative [Zymobacter palmae]|uniref:Ribonuclease BN, putative n=1 Tax=Zymobacter palmae TaxID=33074 RepID=A0A348HI94_9GAMM|nr:ribonuclease BN, putative [Zymobacter palmae]
MEGTERHQRKTRRDMKRWEWVVWGTLIGLTATVLFGWRV